MPRSTPSVHPVARPSEFPLRGSGRPGVVRRAACVVGSGALLTALGACGGTDPFAPVATLQTSIDTFVVYPLSTAPAVLPSALSLYTSQSVRPLVRTNLTINFEIGVDLDAQGRVRLLPPKLLVAPQAGGSLVTGMQVLTNSTFDALTRAPNGGYQYDSATVVTPGQLVAVQTQGAGPTTIVCSSTAPIYAKLVVDSIRPAAIAPGTQAIYLRARVDPNCGFRSLEPGVPKN